jgi:hypothetical protein
MGVIAMPGLTGSVRPRGGSMEQGALVVNSNWRSIKHLGGHLAGRMPQRCFMDRQVELTTKAPCSMGSPQEDASWAVSWS